MVRRGAVDRVRRREDIAWQVAMWVTFTLLIYTVISGGPAW